MLVNTEIDLDKLAEIIERLAFFSDALIAWDCDIIEFNNDNTQQLGLNLADIVNCLKVINI